MARIRTPEMTMFIITVAAAVVLTGTLSLLCYFSYKKLNEVKAETAKLQKEADDLQAKINKLPEIEAERDRLQAEITEYEKMLPDAQEVENLMTMLSEQARLSDCTVGDFSLVEDRRRPGQNSSAGSYDMVKFECSVSTIRAGKGYYSACKFLNLLERYRRFIAADEFEIAGGKGGDTVMTMDLTAHTYVFTGKKTGEGGNKPAAARGRR